MLSTQKAPTSRYEIRILEALQATSRTEKAIAKNTRLPTSIVSELLTELIAQDYVQSKSERKFLFFHRQHFSITLAGLDALENAKNGRLTELLLQMLRGTALTLDGAIPRLGAAFIPLAILKVIIRIVRYVL
jgi:DNA-binding MarR family transcriptional regulator